jgi:hypothetical protein
MDLKNYLICEPSFLIQSPTYMYIAMQMRVKTFVEDFFSEYLKNHFYLTQNVRLHLRTILKKEKLASKFSHFLLKPFFRQYVKKDDTLNMTSLSFDLYTNNNVREYTNKHEGKLCTKSI